MPLPEFKGKTEAGPCGDSMFQLDFHLGQVLDALEKNGFGDNTLVIFTSDNGPEDIAYARIRNHDHKSSGPLRGVKRDIWAEHPERIEKLKSKMNELRAAGQVR